MSWATQCMYTQNYIILLLFFTANVRSLFALIEEVDKEVSPTEKTVEKDDSKTWALLVAGSTDYINYRHQADVCHAYHILLNNSIPPENIIVMMYDDVANSPENPTPGVLINYPGGPDVYKGTIKDYTGNDVTPTNFLNVMKGNSDAMKHIGTGKVINSGPKDRIFIYFTDHGGPGLLAFPDDELVVQDLNAAFKEMANNRSFDKMVLFIEACESGSMFDDVLDDDSSIFVMTASAPDESSFACYCDDETVRGTCLADCFSINWMRETQKEAYHGSSLHHLFQKVRTKTRQSHVEEYGDLDIGSLKFSQFLGMKSKDGRSNNVEDDSDDSNYDYDDTAIPALEIGLTLLEAKLARSNGTESESLFKDVELLKTKRNRVDKLFVEIASKLSNNNETKRKQLIGNRFKINKKNSECYSKTVKSFSKNCLNVSSNSYAMRHLKIFVNACSVNWLSVDQILTCLNVTCFHNEKIKGTL